MGLTHHQAIRNLVLVLFITSLVLCLGVALVISSDASLLGLMIGLLTGGVAGIFVCLYLSSTWDPITLRQSSETNVSGCWLPVVTVSSVLIGRVISSAFGADFIGWLFGFTISIMYIVMSYLVIQIWRHRPK